MSKKRNFEILNLVESVYETHSYSAAQKGLRYTFSVSRKVPTTVCGDFGSVQKALSVITKMAIEDSASGAVEINVDLVSELPGSHVVKFSVTGPAKQNPYWFSVSLETASSKQTA